MPDTLVLRQVVDAHARLVGAQSAVPRDQALVMRLLRERDAAVLEARRQGVTLPELLAAARVSNLDATHYSRLYCSAAAQGSPNDEARSGPDAAGVRWSAR